MLQSALPNQLSTGAATPSPKVRAGNIAWRALAYPALIVTGVLYVVPLGILLLHSVTDPEWGFGNYSRLLTQSGYLRTLGRTLGLAAISTMLALLIGYPIAYRIATSPRAWLRRLLILCVAAPYLTSILIRTFAWQILLGRIGLVNQGLQAAGWHTLELLFNATAVIIGLTHFLLPMMIFPLVSVMRNIEPSLLRASSSLGAGPATGFVKVFVPASWPGIKVGTVLCFVYGVGAFVTPALLGGNSGRMIGALIESAISQQADYGLAAAASILLAAGVAVILLVFRWGLGGRLAELVSPSSIRQAQQHRQRRAPRHSRIAQWASRLAIAIDKSGLSRVPGLITGYALVAGLIILLPQLIAIPISFSSTRTLIFPPPGWSTQWYSGFFSAQWLAPLWTSIEIAAGVTVLSCILGGFAAVGVARGWRGKPALAATVLLNFPLVFPTVVAAAAFFLAWLPLGLTDTKFGILLAHLTIALPFVFILVGANLQMLNPSLERAAASMGASVATQVRRILIPLLSGSLLTGAFFSFLSSFDEASIAVFLSGLQVKTLPRRMYEALSFESDPTIGVIAVLTMVVTALAIAGGARFVRARPSQRQR